MAQPSRFSGAVNEDFLAKRTEAIIEPDLPIIDPHHHLWLRDGNTYLLPELLADLYSGHNVVATVFEECHSMYRASGPRSEASLGETTFVAGIAAMGECGAFGPSRPCARIVGNVSLMLGFKARPLLEQHMIASGGRFAGVRHSTAWHADIHKVAPVPGTLANNTFRAGYQALGDLGLVYDAWVYHTQIDEVADLADAFPNTPIVLNHVGSPILGGPYAGKRDEVFADWKAAMARLAKHPNVTVKLGALPIRLPGDGANRDMPPSSEEIATAWGPWMLTCIELFGASRCMFESNFPVQKRWSSFAITWNGFKRIAAGASPDEKRDLFAGTARRIYGVP